MTATTGVKEDIRAKAEQALSDMGAGDLPVQVLNVQQKSLRDNGFLVDIDVTGVSQFWTSVDWHLDLGIPKGDQRRKSGRLTPGRKMLITKAGKFRSMETRARYNLEKHSHRIAVFGDYRYVPNSAFMAWLDAHQAICEEWESEKADLLANYDDLVYEVRDAFTAMARETWLTLVARNDSETRAWVQSNSLTAFSQAVADKAASKMPTKNEIASSLAIRLRPLATFLLSDEQAQIELDTERHLAEVQKSREQRDHFARAEKAWAEQQEAKVAAAQEEQYQRERAARAEADEQIARAKAETAAIKAAQLEIARAAVVDMANPFADVINDLRAQVGTTVTEVMANIRQHGRVLGKTSEKITNLIDLFRLLHNPLVTPDPQLEAAIAALDNAMDREGADTKRDTGAINQALSSVRQVTSQLWSELAAETSASRGGWEQIDL